MMLVHQVGEDDGALLFLWDGQDRYALEWSYQQTTPIWVDSNRVILWAIYDLQFSFHSRLTPMCKFILGYFPEENIILATLESL